MLKVYVTETRSTFLPKIVTECFSGTAGGSRSQGTAYVVATSKAKAAAYLREAYPHGTYSTIAFSAATMRLATGNTFDALVAAGLLATDGAVYVESIQHGQFAAWSQVRAAWEYAGEVTYGVFYPAPSVEDVTAAATLAAALDLVEEMAERGTSAVPTKAEIDALDLVLAAARKSLA